MDYSKITLGQLLASPSMKIRRHAIGAYKAHITLIQSCCEHEERQEISDNYRITFCPKCNKTLKTSSL